MNTNTLIQLTRKETHSVVAGAGNSEYVVVPKIDLGSSNDVLGGLKKYKIEESPITVPTNTTKDQ